MASLATIRFEPVFDADTKPHVFIDDEIPKFEVVNAGGVLWLGECRLAHVFRDYSEFGLKGRQLIRKRLGTRIIL